MDKPSFFTRQKPWLLPVFVILGALAITGGLAAARSEPPKEEEKIHTTLVDVETAEMQALQLAVQSQGLVNPKYRTELVAQVSGEVVDVADVFVRGGVVKKGDLLAAIDPTNYEVQVQDARAKLASAQAALELEVAQGEVARAEWNQVTSKVPPALGLRKPQLAQAEAQVAAARAALKQAEKDLARTRIVAPYDALVTARDISLGSFVNVGTRLGMVLDVRTAEIRLPVANSELQYLNDNGVGAPVTLHAEVNGVEGTWQANIVRSEGVIDEDSRMTYLVAELPDPYLLYSRKAQPGAEVLPFGSYTVAQIEGKSLPQAMRLPRHLIKEGQLAIAQDGKLAFRPVVVARHQDGYSIVVDGLQAGDQVVTTALEYPVEGMALSVRKPEPTTLAAKGAEADASVDVGETL